jgi:subtilisin family serine protease
MALPAIFALTILSLPLVDPANAQGSSAQRGSTSHGAVASGRGPTGFATIPKGSTGPRGGAGPRAGTQTVSTTIPTISGGPGLRTNTRPKRPNPRPPIVKPIIPKAPPVTVVVERSVGGSTPKTFRGTGPVSGPSNPIIRRPGSGAPTVEPRNYVAGEVLAELPAGTADRTAEDLARRYRLTTLESFDFQLGGTKLYRWGIIDRDRRSVTSVVRQLERAPGVVSASANIISRLQQDPETVGIGAPNRTPLEQYAFDKLQMPQAHALALGERVLIAIIDGGVDISHPELEGAIVETFDAIGSGDPVHPHGTAVAGAIAAKVRLKGTAPAALILAARAFGTDRTSAEGTSFNIVKAIDWAVSRNARIINLSFAGERDPRVEIALRAARERGIVLVAAAGNDGPSSPPRFPAAFSNVIAVTATDRADQLFSAAVRGKHIAVAAPGVDLLLPGPDGTYRQISGTSFSAAEVSGTVALMLERQPNLDPEAVRRTLMSTARDLGPRGVDPQFGAGLVDAYKALMAVSSKAVSSNSPNPR